MPLFSDHISNMYYSGSPSYTSSPYSYNSAIPSYGTSFSASYLNPGGNYSTHSSLGGYSRAPLSSRWISGGRAYSPMLTTISEKGTSSPVRINSPRRIPISGRTYVPSTYTPRPININTADIDVSRDKYRNKVQSCNSTISTSLPPRRESPSTNKENGHDKPDTGIDTSPGSKRSTIKRDRTVVRLHTLKRKERDSPRKPIEILNDVTNALATEDKEKQTESKKWREKLADDLEYKNQKEKKTLGAKLVEKFTLKEKTEEVCENCSKISPKSNTDKEKSPLKQDNNEIISSINKSFDRRCSMELLAEQASLLDSLIRRENLSIAPLDMSKVGSENMLNSDMNLELELRDTIKRKLSHGNSLSTTKSDHSLHDRLFSKNVKDPSFSKKRSLRKCSSGGNICKLDCIKEKFKKPIVTNQPKKACNLPPDEEEVKNKKLKPKMKTKITSTVEVTTKTPPLKFIVEDVTVEETTRPFKKDIIFSSTVEENSSNEIARELENYGKSTKLQEEIEPLEIPDVFEKVESVSTKDESVENIQRIKGHRNSIKKLKSMEKSKPSSNTSGDITSPEPEDGNFWEKIGKRETVYLINRKQIIDKIKEKNKRTLFWFPDEENIDTSEEKNENLDFKLFPHETIKHIGTSNPTDTVNVQEEIKKINESPETEKTNGDIFNLPTIKDNTDYSIRKSESDKESKIEKISFNQSKDSNKNDHKIKSTKEIEKAKIINEWESTVETTKTINKTKDTTINDSKKENSLNRESSVRNQNTSSLKANILLGHTEEIPRISNQNTSDAGRIKSLDIIKDSSETMTAAKISANFSPSKHSHKDSIKNKPIKNDTKGSKTMNTAKLSAELSSTKSSHKDIIKIKSIKKDTEDPSGTINVEKLSAEHLSTKNSQKDNIKNKSAKTDIEESRETNNAEKLSAELSLKKYYQKGNIKNNKETKVKAEVNSSKNLNIPESKIIESPTNKSITQINTHIPVTEINDAKAETQCVLLTSFTNSLSAATAPIQNTETKKDVPIKLEVENSNASIPNNQENATEVEKIYVKNKEDKKASCKETGNAETNAAIKNKNAVNVFTSIRPVKEEKAIKPLIATPRPLQKKNPQTIRSSSSSSEDESSEEETDEDDDDDDDAPGSGSSHGSTRYLECENIPDGRTSTGSNDSGFDSSAPTSPSGFLHAKKDCDVNCHRKCEKLTANLCGVNQRLLVEALASRTTSKRGGDSPSTSAGVTSPQTFTHEILEQELEQSTAYDLFRKTGRFTPPARSIPRFRKYTIEDFQFIRVLGKGSFGKVMLAELRDTEYYYAVKCLKKDVVLEDDDVECTLIERKVLALGTNHPYLCHLFATFQTDSHLFFVMEYLNGGDLMFHIQQSGRFPEPRARFYAAEIVSGLKFLHKRGIVYRDLKLDNILLDFDGHVRIADFGMCKLQIYLDKTADTFCGTPDYMAPEIIRGLKYNQTVDWWSFGVLLYEMLIGQSPFSGCDEDELFWSICNEMPSYPRFLSSESLSILTRLLDKDAKTRLGGPECMHGDIRDQKFFEQIQWDKLERRELEAPFKPRVRHPMDTQYFDRAFTGERPRLTAVEPQVLRSMDQEPFRGFSYTNPNATDR